MGRYLTARLLHSALTLIGASIFIFMLLRVIPGDPAAMLLPEGTPQSVVDQMSRQMGLKQPLYTQYGLFIKKSVTGDFGDSFQYRAPATAVIGERLMATVALTAAAMALTILFGVTIGIVAAVKRGSAYDYGGTIFAVLGQALPNFWLGIMLILFFGVRLGWLPTSGFDGPTSLILPAVTLAAYPTAFVARLTRSSMLEVLGQDFVRTARAKGLRERVVVLRHAFRNSLIPVLTVIGLQIGALLGGAVITESVFAWPGIGKLVVDSVFFRDFPVVQAILILSTTTFIVINLLVDLAYAFLDPRIRYW